MKKVIAAVLVASQFAGFAQSAHAQSDDESDFTAAVRSMQHSVAPVMCIRAVQPQLQPMQQQQIPPPSQSGSQPSGSGSPQLQPVVAGTAFFLTRRGDFVTAASVLGNFIEPGPFAGCTMMVWFASPVDAAGNFNSQGFLVALNDCVIDASIDVARCRTIGDLTKAYGGRFTPIPVAFEDRQPDAGSAVGTTGYILFDTVAIAARGHVGGYQPAPPSAAQMVLDRPAGPGSAGSPVYDSRGKVLGMVAQVRNLVLTDISVASTSLVISRFLAAHPIEDK
ncbi:MAG TPA: serine protease [Rhizomicrobium sp.]|jgi:hypothetical protein|nr:serine protease [Rhizomicrobium sp.]